MSHTQQIAKEISIVFPKLLKSIHAGTVDKIDVPPAQIAAMVVLAELNNCTINQLSQEMKVSAPTVTGIVDRLERAKLVRRKRDTVDRRVVHIHLTAHGHKGVRKIHQAFMQRWTTIAHILTIQDQKRYLSIFKKILKGLDEQKHL